MTAEPPAGDKLAVLALVRADLDDDGFARDALLTDTDPTPLLAAAVYLLCAAVEGVAHEDGCTPGEVLDNSIRATIRRAAWLPTPDLDEDGAP